MQNRYVGDIGDFGKYGMLRAIGNNPKVRLGVNWYLVPDESHTNDGKFTDYLYPSHSKFSQLKSCDTSLFDKLKTLVESGNRNVEAIQTSGLFSSGTIFYSDYLPESQTPKYQYNINQATADLRRAWFSKSISALAECNLLFLDPDNGLEVSSAPIGSAKCEKYVLYDEIGKYFKAGHSLIIYNHRDRSSEDVYRERIAKIRDYIGQDIPMPILRYQRQSVRDYVFVLQKEHSEEILRGLSSLVASKWSAHWKYYEV